MTWIINVPVDLREYMYKGPDFGNNHPISLKKPYKYIRIGESAVLWNGYHTNKIGISGYGIIMSKFVKPRELKEYKEHCYNLTMPQIEIQIKEMNYENSIIPKIVSYWLPSLNEFQKVRIYNKTGAVWGFNIHSEILFIKQTLWNNDFFWSIDNDVFQYPIHLLRERFFNIYLSRFKKQILKNQNKCNVCNRDLIKEFGEEIGSKLYEFHENLVIDFNKEYTKINANNFDVLCPVCHKYKHQITRK